jgi:hypothetical protein
MLHAGQVGKGEQIMNDRNPHRIPLFSRLPILSNAWAATYYVDATNGNDANNGLSEVTPWKTIAKVNAPRFNPGVRR